MIIPGSVLLRLLVLFGCLPIVSSVFRIHERDDFSPLRFAFVHVVAFVNVRWTRLRACRRSLTSEYCVHQ